MRWNLEEEKEVKTEKKRGAENGGEETMKINEQKKEDELGKE
jgi:hypothetical protein